MTLFGIARYYDIYSFKWAMVLTDTKKVPLKCTVSFSMFLFKSFMSINK